MTGKTQYIPRYILRHAVCKSAAILFKISDLLKTKAVFNKNTTLYFLSLSSAAPPINIPTPLTLILY